MGSKDVANFYLTYEWDRHRKTNPVQRKFGKDGFYSVGKKGMLKQNGLDTSKCPTGEEKKSLIWGAIFSTG